MRHQSAAVVVGRAGLLALAVGLLPAGASAQLVVLTDRNSVARFDTSSGGQFDWVVNGTDHLFNQWFYVRAGNDTREFSLDTFVRGPVDGPFDTNPSVDPAPDTFSQSFTDPAGRFRVDASFQLRGDGPVLLSDILESFTIRNLTPNFLPVSFFQYADFDLNGTAGGDMGEIIAGNRPRQWEGTFVLEEAAVTPVPSRYEIGPWPSILNSLNDNAITNLSNFGGPLGPGDLAWALQWDFILGPGGEFQISKDKQLTPAPGAAVLLGLGGLLAGRRRRR